MTEQQWLRGPGIACRAADAASRQDLHPAADASNPAAHLPAIWNAHLLKIPDSYTLTPLDQPAQLAEAIRALTRCTTSRGGDSP